MTTGLAEAPAHTWNPHTALAFYRATMHRMGDWYNAADIFDRPSLKRADIVAADRACQAAWTRQDWPGLARALATWERALCGEGSL